MELLAARIKNFRSISDITVVFEPSCRVLVGINESGKSNILKALSLLGNQKMSHDDVRQPLPKEQEIKDSYILFEFKLEKEDRRAVCEEIKNEILTRNSRIIAEKCLAKALYKVDILNGKKKAFTWNEIQDDKLFVGWKKPSAECPDNFEVTVGKNKFPLKGYKAVDRALTKSIPVKYLEEIDQESILKLIDPLVKKLIVTNLPNVILWTYSEKNLLPPQIKIADFSDKPHSCTPLKNLFILAGVKEEEIKDKIDYYQKRGSNRFQSFFDRIAEHATDFFRSVWKDYENIKFSLKVDGENLVPGVKELNTYDFQHRSDGFKRFIGFLLMVSVNVKTNVIKNSLLLIDEADMSLHPSGVEYLRDELIKISDKNTVVYSTHSIFMIDPKKIERHIKVEKRDEITNIEDVTESNILDEEVVYNALGHSVFKLLKEKNLMFEGWKDKKFFQVALARVPRKYAAIKELKEYGLCHAHGAKSIKHITPILEIAKRKCVIVTDADKPAREQQTAYVNNKGHGLWKRYDELEGQTSVVTSEDYISNEFYLDTLKDILAKHTPKEVKLKKITLQESKGKLESTKISLKKMGIDNGDIENIVNELKDKLYDSFARANIKPRYYEMLVDFHKICSKYFS